MVKNKLDSIPVHEGDKVTFFNFRVIEGSHAVARIGWPVTGEPLMLVEFHGQNPGNGDGPRYAYYPVTRQQAVAAAYHKSVGKYLHRRIFGSKKSYKLG